MAAPAAGAPSVVPPGLAGGPAPDRAFAGRAPWDVPASEAAALDLNAWMDALAPGAPGWRAPTIPTP